MAADNAGEYIWRCATMPVKAVGAGAVGAAVGTLGGAVAGGIGGMVTGATGAAAFGSKVGYAQAGPLGGIVGVLGGLAAGGVAGLGFGVVGGGIAGGVGNAKRMADDAIRDDLRMIREKERRENDVERANKERDKRRAAAQMEGGNDDVLVLPKTMIKLAAQRSADRRAKLEEDAAAKRAALVAFYTKHNEEKLPEVDNILARFVGDDDGIRLGQAMYRKYGEAPWAVPRPTTREEEEEEEERTKKGSSWRSSSGRTDGPDHYVFGDMTRSTLNSLFGGKDLVDAGQKAMAPETKTVSTTLPSPKRSKEAEDAAAAARFAIREKARLLRVAKERKEAEAAKAKADAALAKAINQLTNLVVSCSGAAKLPDKKAAAAAVIKELGNIEKAVIANGIHLQSEFARHMIRDMGREARAVLGPTAWDRKVARAYGRALRATSGIGLMRYGDM